MTASAYPLGQKFRDEGTHLYCCGPRRLMNAVRDMTGHWPDSAVHFEDFVGATANRTDNTEFTVKLSKSGTQYTVAAGTSILDTLRKNAHSFKPETPLTVTFESWSMCCAGAKAATET